jgi:uncharacterized HhH-GPD family protein
MPNLTLTSDADADALLSENGFALLVGMLLDQQISMELAFIGPHRLERRIEGPLTPQTIMAMDLDELEQRFRQKPALHRYPGSMAKRVHALASYLVEEYDGEAARIWEGVRTATQLRERLSDLPGYGEQKVRIFVALLAKQCGVAPDGWEAVAGDYAKEGHRSIADVTGPDSLAKVREWKQAQKSRSASTA